MANRATTEVFAEMVVEIETSGGTLPASQLLTSLSNANPAVATVPTIAAFVAGDVVYVSIPAPNAALSGSYVVGVVTGSTFPLTGLNASALAAPLTQTNAAGLSIQPAIPNTLVWSKICGITSRTVNRTTTIQTTEIPDCSDESLPNSIEKSVTAQEQTVTGTGVWAAQSHSVMMEWWRAGSRKSIRIGNIKAPTGSVKYEYGPAFLTQLNHTAEKGPKVTADITIEFDGLPAVQYV